MSVVTQEGFADEPVQRVFCSDALLHRIAAACSPRSRLILGTLDKACRRAADSPDLWRVISWRIVGGDQPLRVWTYAEAAEMGNRLGLVLRQFGRHCFKLDLCGCRWLQNTGLEELARCVNLRTLDMSGCCDYRLDVLGCVVRRCPQLRTLRLRGCRHASSPPVIQELFDLPDQLHLNLQHLDLQGVPFTQDRQLLGCDLGHTLGRLAGGAPGGQSPGQQAQGEGQQVQGEGQQAQRQGPGGVEQQGPRLVSLRLGWTGESAPDASDQLYVGNLAPVLRAVGRCGATLRLLDMAGCFFTLSGDTASAAAALRPLSALRVLSLTNWHSLERGSRVEGGALRQCGATALVYLNLRASSPLLSDSDLLPLLAANPGLRYLNLSCAGTAVTDAALLGAARSCPRLEALDVCHADGMTEEGVRQAARLLPGLTDYGFSGFRGLGDGDIADIAAALPRLRMIGFGSIPRLTDAALRALAAAPCRAHLTQVYMASLPNVTSQGVSALLSGCPSLAAVAAEGCELLAAADQRLLAERYPYVYDGDVVPEEYVRLAYGEDEYGT